LARACEPHKLEGFYPWRWHTTKVVRFWFQRAVECVHIPSIGEIRKALPWITPISSDQRFIGTGEPCRNNARVLTYKCCLSPTSWYDLEPKMPPHSGSYRLGREVRDPRPPQTRSTSSPNNQTDTEWRFKYQEARGLARLAIVTIEDGWESRLEWPTQDPENKSIGTPSGQNLCCGPANGCIAVVISSCSLRTPRLAFRISSRSSTSTLVLDLPPTTG